MPGNVHLACSSIPSKETNFTTLAERSYLVAQKGPPANSKMIYPIQLLSNKLNTTYTVVTVRSIEQAERYKFLRQVHNATNTVTKQ